MYLFKHHWVGSCPEEVDDLEKQKNGVKGSNKRTGKLLWPSPNVHVTSTYYLKKLIATCLSSAHAPVQLLSQVAVRTVGSALCTALFYFSLK